MKLSALLISCFITITATAQDITLDYTNDNGITIKHIAITKGMKILKVKGVATFTKFTITVKNLAANNKLHFNDDAGALIHTFSADGTSLLTSVVDLNNAILEIIAEDNNAVKTEFAKILIENLPASSFNIISKVPELATVTNTVCEPCTFLGNAIVYDFASNSFSYKNKIKWAKLNLANGHPVVGHPFTFSVKNINPFRDSVIISSETMDFNTEVPELFNKAFFSPALLSLNPQQAKILSDVIEMGQQINKIIEILKSSKECTDICTIIQKVKDETEKYFTTQYNFDPQKGDLNNFIFIQLDGMDPLYRDSVTTILNNYRSFYNTRNYFNYNIPQIQNVDQYIFTLSVLPKAGAKSHTVVDHQPVTVNTVGGVKFDFSSGLFITGLRDERFSFRPDSTVIRDVNGADSIVFNRRNQIIQLSDDKKSDFGVAALMHFYPRITPFFNIGLTLGAGVSIGPNPSIRYLGGGSLILGKSGRLIVSYGCAAGFVDVLSDSYQNLQYVSLTDTKAISKKAFKTNSFFAVTFNIPLFKSKIKADESKEEAPAEASAEAPKTEDEKKSK